MRLITLTSSLILLGACTTTPQESIAPDAFVSAVMLKQEEPPEPQIVETVTPLPLPGQMMNIASARTTTMSVKATLPPSAAIKKGRASALVEPSVDGYVNAIQVYPYTEGALYRLYASPGQVSDIALQPGEELVSVSAGDTVRWVVGDTVSGAGAKARGHVLVKPISAGIRTNLMIATDRRTYHLELESVESGYMAALSWRYPADELAELTARKTQTQRANAPAIEAGLQLDELNFAYRLSGDRPAWKPVRVFDDGRQVFIQMPDAALTSDMPPLFVLGESGDAELVNYRIRGKYYVVDRLFRAAELRLGAKKQVKVRIQRRENRSPLARLFGS